MRISDWSSDWCSSDLDNDSAGLAQAFDRDGVLFGRIPLKITQRPKGKPFNGNMLLDGHRYAVERPQWLAGPDGRSEEHTSEIQYLMRTSFAVICLKKQTQVC